MSGYPPWTIFLVITSCFIGGCVAPNCFTDRHNAWGYDFFYCDDCCCDDYTSHAHCCSCNYAWIAGVVVGVLLLIGIIVTIVVICCCCQGCPCYRGRRTGQTQGVVYQPGTGPAAATTTVVTAGYPGYQAQPAFVQPQAGQPPPGYPPAPAQPPPGYPSAQPQAGAPGYPPAPGYVQTPAQQPGYPPAQTQPTAGYQAQEKSAEPTQDAAYTNPEYSTIE